MTFSHYAALRRILQ